MIKQISKLKSLCIRLLLTKSVFKICESWYENFKLIRFFMLTIVSGSLTNKIMLDRETSVYIERGLFMKIKLSFRNS